MAVPMAAGTDTGQALADMWRSIVLFLPKFIVFVVILVVGWLIARLVRGLVDRVLRRVGFDRAVERSGINKALSGSRFDAAGLVGQLVYYGLLLVTLQLAFGVWGPNPVSDLIRAIVGWIPKALVAIIIIVIAAAIANAVRTIVSNALGRLSYGRMLARIAAWFIIGIGVIAALNQVGIATSVTTPVLIAVLATIAGILIIGVGGGLVRPMQDRWQRWLDRAEAESSTIAAHARQYAESRRQPETAAATAPVPTPSGPREADRAYGAGGSAADTTQQLRRVQPGYTLDNEPGTATIGGSTEYRSAASAGTPDNGTGTPDNYVTRTDGRAVGTPEGGSVLEGTGTAEPATDDPNRTMVVGQTGSTATGDVTGGSNGADGTDGTNAFDDPNRTTPINPRRQRPSS